MLSNITTFIKKIISKFNFHISNYLMHSNYSLINTTKCFDSKKKILLTVLKDEKLNTLTYKEVF